MPWTRIGNCVRKAIPEQFYPILTECLRDANDTILDKGFNQ
jgi:hypothetical protein